jgi:hypothetical protein
MTLRCWAPPMVDCFQVCCLRRVWSTPPRAGHTMRCSRPLKSLWKLDGRLKVFPRSYLSEAKEEKLEEALTERCLEILEETDLFILCAIFDSQS